MGFDLQYNIDPIDVEDASLFFCEDPDCKDSLEVLGPFGCDQYYCSYHYGGSGYYKLVIDFADKTRESNIFQKTTYNASYTVTVNQDGLQVTENPSPVPYETESQVPGFLIALAITLPIELLVAWIFTRLTKKSFKAWVILIANLITLPLVWFVFPLIPLNSFVVLLLAEIFALLFETWLIQRTFEDFSYLTAFWLSLCMNLGSFLIPVLFSLY